MAIDYDKLPNALEVKHIKEILNCGKDQAYELVNSGQFHVARVGCKAKVSKRLFFEWFEGREFTEWLNMRQQQGE
ncbi:helix-turn-helix domain-containing protein [Shouchella clausii]|uniref:helix-turn-helix domain-containing protein n=1 Tax=Shouchella clausii TaxID=79880 RepID=UPI0007894000|nr:helix-turn-helix domain-containing protein [Shouchella clausii]